MTEQLHHVVDRSRWGRGPWDEEPEDRIEWRSDGVPCLMVRNGLGSWCGYVACEPGHPWFEKGYDDVSAEAHGGLTYADHCSGPICYVAQEGEPDRVWWLGFDCAHYMDWTPGLNHHGSEEEYRDIPYVREQVERLAEQLRVARVQETHAG